MRWAWAVVAAALVPAVTAGPASAHATIVRTAPADTTVLKTAPKTVDIRWSEPVAFGKGSVRLLDASGKPVAGAAGRHGADPATAAIAVPEGLRNGTYVVAWKVTSADSHPVSGAFSFSIGRPSAIVSAGSDEGPSTFVEALDALARGLAFVGLALALGGALLVGPARLTWIGAALLAGGTLAAFLLQAPYAGESLGFTLSTRFGHALLARLALTAAFAVAVNARARLVAAPLAVALLFTWTLADHSRTGVQTWLGVPAATVHLGAMAVWFGGLVAVLVAGGDARRFSRFALVAFGALGVTGVYLAWRQSGALGALPGTDFGKLLLVKSGVVVGILAIANVSRRAVARGASVRRTVLAEAVLGLTVLALTATLVNAEPARVAYSPPVDVTKPGPEGGRVQLHLEPAKQGENVLDVYLLAKGGGLIVAPEVTARLAPPEGEKLEGDLPIELTPGEPGHYVAQRMTVPFPGTWTVELSVRTSDIDEDVVRLPVKVR